MIQKLEPKVVIGTFCPWTASSPNLPIGALGVSGWVMGGGVNLTLTQPGILPNFGVKGEGLVAGMGWGLLAAEAPWKFPLMGVRILQWKTPRALPEFQEVNWKQPSPSLKSRQTAWRRGAGGSSSHSAHRKVPFPGIWKHSSNQSLTQKIKRYGVHLPRSPRNYFICFLPPPLPVSVPV